MDLNTYVFGNVGRRTNRETVKRKSRITVSKEVLSKYASKGYQVAFKHKANANAYIRELRRYGYNKAGYMRSSGPTIDAKGRVIRAYYVVPDPSKL